MDNFISNLTSWDWIFSVLVVGVILSVLGSYLRTLLDRFFISISQSWRNSSKANKAKWDVKVQNLVDNPAEKSILVHKELRCRLKGIMFLLVALFLIISPKLLSTVGSGIVAVQIFGMITFFVALNFYSQADKLNRLVDDAQDKLSKKNQ